MMFKTDYFVLFLIIVAVILGAIGWATIEGLIWLLSHVSIGLKQ